MTASNQYNDILIARLFGGFFASNSVTLVLHQRGKACGVLSIAFLSGAVIRPMLSSFIVATTTRPVKSWWSNTLETLIILVTLCSLDETYFDRTAYSAMRRQSWPKSWVANRIAIFSPMELGSSHRYS